MENARHLDERLKKIISEVSRRTGGEINRALLSNFEQSVQSILEDRCRRETFRLLTLLKKAVDKFS